MKAMKMSADGRAKLMQREGVRTKAYKDSVFHVSPRLRR